MKREQQRAFLHTLRTLCNFGVGEVALLVFAFHAAAAGPSRPVAAHAVVCTRLKERQRAHTQRTETRDRGRAPIRDSAMVNLVRRS